MACIRYQISRLVRNCLLGSPAEQVGFTVQEHEQLASSKGAIGTVCLHCGAGLREQCSSRVTVDLTLIEQPAVQLGQLLEPAVHIPAHMAHCASDAATHSAREDKLTAL